MNNFEFENILIRNDIDICLFIFYYLSTVKHAAWRIEKSDINIFLLSFMLILNDNI